MRRNMVPVREYRPLDDDDFDALLPEHPRDRSCQYWTPMEVARLAARRLSEHGARNVLDVGSGPGKFCLVGAMQRPEVRFWGVEQRPDLVALANELARKWAVRNAHFAVGDATRFAWECYDGFYFFNPFGENLFDGNERYDAAVELSRARFAADLLRVEQQLTRAPLGSVVVTYHGLGGPIPSSYDLMDDDVAGSDRVRTWVRRRDHEESWAWIEKWGDVVPTPRDLILRFLKGEESEAPREPSWEAPEQPGQCRSGSHEG